MDINEKMTGMIDYILNHATKYELELVGEALRKRMERESSLGFGQIDVQQMARSMAEGIEKQMGLDGNMLHKMSRRLVADMIRREKPDINERDLKALLGQMVPGRGLGGAAVIPKEMLLEMISQFLAFSNGELTEEEKREYPDGWYKKYWEAFPADIQKTIRDYIQGRISKNELWRKIKDSPALLK